METHELDKIKMQTMDDIAKGNLAIGQMKADLKQLEEDKERFFEQREKEVIDKLFALLDNSTLMLQDIKSNYGAVHEFYNIVISFSDFLKEGQAQFEEVVRAFDQHSQDINAAIDLRTEEVEKERKLLAIEKARLEEDKTFIESQRQKLSEERAHIESQQQQIKAAMAALEKKQDV